MSQHLGQVQSAKDVYTTSQTDTVLVSCPNGRSLFVWNIIVNSDSDSVTTIEFNSSPKVEILTTMGGNMGSSCVDILGGQNEDILVTCPANTTVRVQYTLE